MKTVILDVATRKDAGEDFIRAWETGKAQKHARISFEPLFAVWVPSQYAKRRVGLAGT